MTEIKPRRSVLYMPGANGRALEKARGLAADCLIFDLEEAVGSDSKDEARTRVAEALARGGYGGREIALRVNALTTPWGEADIAMAARSGVDAVLFPRAESPADIDAVRRALSAAGAPPGLALWAMMETPLAVLQAREIAGAAADAMHPLTVFVMGTNDLAKETRAATGGERYAMVTWLSICIAAARAYNIDIVDGVFNDFRDVMGFVRECDQGRELGFDGKTLIHPSQIEHCNDAFGPTAAEIAWARRVLAAFDAPDARGKGVLSIDGRMIERLHAEIAARTMAISEAIETRSHASD